MSSSVTFCIPTLVIQFGYYKPTIKHFHIGDDDEQTNDAYILYSKELCFAKYYSKPTIFLIVF